MPPSTLVLSGSQAMRSLSSESSGKARQPTPSQCYPQALKQVGRGGGGGTGGMQCCCPPQAAKPRLVRVWQPAPLPGVPSRPVPPRPKSRLRLVGAGSATASCGAQASRDKDPSAGTLEEGLKSRPNQRQGAGRLDCFNGDGYSFCAGLSALRYNSPSFLHPPCPSSYGFKVLVGARVSVNLEPPC
jgi:hypothetical protein